jgi:hypothetical protein
MRNYQESKRRQHCSSLAKSGMQERSSIFQTS